MCFKWNAQFVLCTFVALMPKKHVSGMCDNMCARQLSNFELNENILNNMQSVHEWRIRNVAYVCVCASASDSETNEIALTKTPILWAK